ncbi:MAG TPA: hypothetical protein VK646_02755 [Actinomycetota bacterium]|nr:hypothetical protein [Actinomycetota bacterium]
MQTEVTFIGGEIAEFDETAEVKLNAYGVEVVQREGDEQVRVLFPWPRIEKVTQRGSNVTAIYTYS